jgi:hypothetical protein
MKPSQRSSIIFVTIGIVPTPTWKCRSSRCTLVKHQDWFGVAGLALQAMVSPATASQVLTELEHLDWLVARGQGPSKERHLREPAALLNAWAKQLATIRPPAPRRCYVPGTKAGTLAARIGQIFDAHDVQYEVSYEAAAQRYAPFLSNISQVRARADRT